MVTSLELGKGRPAKAYKTIGERTYKLRSTENWFEVEVDDEVLDIRKSMLYLGSRILKMDFQFELGENISMQEAMRMVDKVNKPLTSVINLTDGTVDNKKQYNSKMSNDDWNASLLLNNGSSSYFMYTICDIVWGNTRLANEFINVPCLMAVVGTNNKFIVVPNVVNTHSLLVYYWFCRNGSDHLLMNTLYQSGMVQRPIGLKVDKDSSFVDFLKTVYKSKKDIDVMVGYLKAFNTGNPYDALVEYHTQYTEAVYRHRTDDKLCGEWIERAYNYLSSKEVHDETKRILGVKRRRIHASLLVALAVVIPRMTLVWEDEACLAAEYFRETKLAEKNEEDGIARKDLEAAIRQLGLIQNNFISIYSLGMTVHGMDKLNQGLSNLEHDKNLVNQQRDKIQAKYQDARSRLKEATKQNKELEQRLRAETVRADRLQAHIESDGVSPEELASIKEHNAKLRREKEDKKSTINDLQRQLNKRDKDIEYLTAKVNEYRADGDELRCKLDKANELAYQMSKHRSFSEIPMECFVSAIKSKRIMLIGGDMMHKKIRDYGLDNIKLYKAGCKEITYEDMSDIDILVIATSFVDHSSIEGAIKTARAHDIQHVKFNNKNADLLIYTLFQEIYK